MKTNKEILKYVLTDDIIEKVKQLINSNDRIIYLNHYESEYRLLKSEYGNINFEIPIELLLNKNNELITNTITDTTPFKILFYYKPICYFDFSIENRLTMSILKEYEEDLLFLIDNGLKKDNKLFIKRLSLKENAVIASFTKEASLYAEQIKDISFVSNGLNCDIYLTRWGDIPQVFLDDKYDLTGPIAAYLNNNGQKSANPIIEYQDLYNKLLSMGLLSVFK